MHFTAVCIYTTKSSTPAISLFFLGPNPVVVHIFGVPTGEFTFPGGVVDAGVAVAVCWKRELRLPV